MEWVIKGKMQFGKKNVRKSETQKEKKRKKKHKKT
jgi:hypothetical protein